MNLVMESSRGGSKPNILFITKKDVDDGGDGVNAITWNEEEQVTKKKGICKE